MISLLIAEDKEKMRRLLKSLLGDLVSAVWECSDGAEALAAYRRHRPDFVLMDIQMKLMDGITATQRIKAVDPAARIIIVTDYDQAELREAARQAGACAYVSKENLLELVRFLQEQSANPSESP
jgi:two-component system response regulator DegU